MFFRMHATFYVNNLLRTSFVSIYSEHAVCTPENEVASCKLAVRLYSSRIPKTWALKGFCLDFRTTSMPLLDPGFFGF